MMMMMMMVMMKIDDSDEGGCLTCSTAVYDERGITIVDGL